jgi:hypothetical protein
VAWLACLLVALLLLFGNNATFVANFNELAPKFGAQGGDVYAATLAAGEAAGTVAGPLLPIAFGASIFLVPMLTFFNCGPTVPSVRGGSRRF